MQDDVRRKLLKSMGALGAGLAAPSFFVRNAWAASFRNDPGNSRTVTLGFNVPQSGPYADEGNDELKAFKLAVKHLNGEGDGGMIKTFKPSSLKGNGILGKKVQYVTGDTQTKADAARASAKRMIEKDGVIMFSGGSSSAVAVATQSLAQEMGIVFMVGLSHSNDTTMKDRRRYGFRHFFNAYMSGQALAPILAQEMGKDRRAYHLTADYTWGWTQEESMKNATEALGWKTVKAVRTPLGAGDFSQYITPVLNSGADVLILNHYGKDMVNSLRQAVQFGLRDKMVNGKKFEIVVPLYSRLMAQGAGDASRASSAPPTGTGRSRTRRARCSPSRSARSTANRRRRRRTPATCRRCCTPTRSSRPAPSIRPRSSRSSKASSSTAWATVRRCTAPATTSASRTCW